MLNKTGGFPAQSNVIDSEIENNSDKDNGGNDEEIQSQYDDT